MINNIVVKVGDRVFVLQKGYGHVVSSRSDGSFDVQIGNEVMSYSTGGYVGPQRRVYWENPIIIDPKKDDVAFEAAADCFKSIYEKLK